MFNHPRRLTACHWKWMVGKWNFLVLKVSVQGRAVQLGGCILRLPNLDVQGEHKTWTLQCCMLRDPRSSSSRTLVTFHSFGGSIKNPTVIIPIESQYLHPTDQTRRFHRWQSAIIILFAGARNRKTQHIINLTNIWRVSIPKEESSFKQKRTYICYIDQLNAENIYENKWL